MVDYDPKDAVRVWPRGEYPATLIEVQDKTSKIKPGGGGGNPMQALKWQVFNSADGQSQFLTDYIVFPAFTWKLKQLAKALGKETEFNVGEFQADDNIGCNLMVDLMIEQQEGFDEQNKINRYKPVPMGQAAGVSHERKEPVKPPFDPNATTSEIAEADIPF